MGFNNNNICDANAMEVRVALEVKVHARMRDEGTTEYFHTQLKPKEDKTINAMVQRRIGELQAEIQTYLTLTRGTNDSPINRAYRQRADKENTPA